MKLDRTKPFGTVHGSGDRRQFEQDGRFFDSDGEEVVAATLEQPVYDRKRYAKDVAEAAKILAAGAQP